MPLYALTIFLGAFLLFQIQPVMGKYILPWFGGGASIWTTCLLFFQLTLLGGYVYAHLLSSRLTRRAQTRLHIIVLALSVAAYVFAPDPEIWKPAAEDSPTLRIMLLLLVTIGAPYFALSSTSPLIQRWFSWQFPGRSPYRLYSLSNLASLLALLSYPFVVEPALKLSHQLTLWSSCYALFAVFCAACAIRAGRIPTSDNTATSSPAEARTSSVPLPTLALWILLAATGSAMLLATTNQICQEVAVVPFLWVLPLSLYLVTFIICFDNPRWYDRRVFGALLLIAVPLATEMLVQGITPPIQLQIPAYLLALFAGCMCCHGELVRSKPAPAHLTIFYLAVSAGGALGGLFVALVAPRFFLGFWEYHISLWIGCALTFFCWWRDGAWRSAIRQPALLWAPLALYMILLSIVLGGQFRIKQKGRLATSRNFYGVVSVTERTEGGESYRSLLHGRINHGFQNIDEEKSNWPTSYYGPKTGVSLAINRHPDRIATPSLPLRVGTIGLGIGTIACYGHTGDDFHFYEINPAVEGYARDHFTYLDDSAADVRVTLGDGRIMMENELLENPDGALYDVMVFDAFTSDAIPIHLITIECFQIYWKLLKPNGLLVFNISNNYVDLTPVCRGIINRFGCQGLHIRTRKQPELGLSATTWIIFTENEDFLDDPIVQESNPTRLDPNAPHLLWTDDFASLWKVIER